MKRGKTSAQANFLVQVDREHDVGSVAQGLRALGLHVERELPTVGIVGGHGRRALLPELRKVPGVKTVREEGAFQLPPFDSKVPQ